MTNKQRASIEYLSNMDKTNINVRASAQLKSGTKNLAFGSLEIPMNKFSKPITTQQKKKFQ